MKHLRKFNESVGDKPSIEEIENGGKEINDFDTQNYDEEQGVVTIYDYNGEEYRIVTWEHGAKEILDTPKKEEETIDTSKTRVLYVGSPDDYGMLSFQDKHAGTPVIDVINDIKSFESKPEDEGTWELSVYEYGEVDPEFVKFVRDRIQDYEDSKHHGFFLQNETVER